MNNIEYSGSSYYDEEDVSMRSDPPMLYEVEEQKSQEQKE